MPGLAGARVLLVIGGGIAAYKALETIRRLQDRGVRVRVVMTAAAQHFVTPLSAAALSGDTVYTDLWSLTDEAHMGHIQLSRDADLVVVAPATADLIASMVGGHADDLATTLLLATDKRTLVVPAMNVRMWVHPATQRNVAQLRADGIIVAGPAEGAMACGEFGPGRMLEPSEIVAAVEAALAGDTVLPLVSRVSGGRLAGRHVLVTAGPTHEPIDPVRYLANRSSGRQGFAVADAAVKAGARVTLVSGPVNLPAPPGVTFRPVETARDMMDAVEADLPADIAIFAAAVADWRVAGQAEQKIKKGLGTPSLALVENPDILATVSHHPMLRPRLVIGFAAETTSVADNAQAKLQRKGCDLIVANDVSPTSGVMGGVRNQVSLISAAGIEPWPEMGKEVVAARLVERAADMLAALETGR